MNVFYIKYVVMTRFYMGFSGVDVFFDGKVYELAESGCRVIALVQYFGYRVAFSVRDWLVV